MDVVDNARAEQGLWVGIGGMLRWCVCDGGMAWGERQYVLEIGGERAREERYGIFYFISSEESLLFHYYQFHCVRRSANGRYQRL